MNTFWQTAVEIDQRLNAKNLPYCIIKSYGGDPEYLDGNIDVVTTEPLRSVYRSAFADAFEISTRDRTKNVLYERNKLMLSPKTDRFCKIHLHSNVGWHNLCFIDGQKVIENAREVPAGDSTVRVLSRDMGARAFVLHVIFEQFKKNPWDLNFLTWEDYLSFAADYEIDIPQLKIVHEAQGPIEISDLRPIWKQYYRARRGEVSLWSRFLHELLVFVQSRRRSNNS